MSGVVLTVMVIGCGGEARAGAKYSTTHRADPTTKKYLTPNANSVDIKKPYPSTTHKEKVSYPVNKLELSSQCFPLACTVLHYIWNNTSYETEIVLWIHENNCYRKNACIEKQFHSSRLYQNGFGYYQPKKKSETLFHTIPLEDFWNILTFLKYCIY